MHLVDYHLNFFSALDDMAHSGASTALSGVGSCTLRFFLASREALYYNQEQLLQTGKYHSKFSFKIIYIYRSFFANIQNFPNWIFLRPNHSTNNLSITSIWRSVTNIDNELRVEHG